MVVSSLSREAGFTHTNGYDECRFQVNHEIGRWHELRWHKLLRHHGSDGKLSVSPGMYTCDANTPVYALVLGGNPGSGNNSAIGLMEYLGPCTISGGISNSTSLIVNEVSTIAMAYAVGAFAKDPTHVIYDSSTAGTQGMLNAFTMAASLVNTTTTGGPTAATGSASVPQAALNTYADVIAACVNTSNPSVTATNCATLFNAATSDGTSSGAIPADTATAAINIAHHPGANVSTLYYLISATLPFQPTLSSTPNDLTLQLTFANGDPNTPGVVIGEPWAIAIDGQGNAWVASLVNGSIATSDYSQGGSVLKISPADQVLSPAGGYSSSAFGANASPFALAVDSANNVWVGTYSSVVKLNSSGTLLGTYLAYGTNPSGCSTADFEGAGGLALDRNGNVWIAGPPVFELSSSGTNMSGCGYGSSLSYAGDGIAVDGQNYIWVADYGNDAVAKLDPSTGAVLNTVTDSSISMPSTIAIDSANSVWVANGGNSTLTRILSSGTVTSFTGGGLNTDFGIAVDSQSSAWATPNAGTDIGVVGVSPVSGGPFTGPTGYATGVSQVVPYANYAHYSSAVDGSGNVWVTNTEWTGSGASLTSKDSISEILGAASPVLTPLAVAVANGTPAVAP